MKPEFRCVCGCFEGMQRRSGLLAAAVIVTFWSVAALAQSAFVRVNQAGYLTGASKRAYLMSSGSETGAAFTVKNSSGTSVFSAAIGANQGSWSNSFPYVYALDLDAVTAAGTYTISVTGPIAATSPNFKIDTGTNVYSTALSNTLFYYQTERDGPNFIANALRTAAGHLNDQHAQIYTWNSKGSEGTPTGVYIDASGGWFDAGDYMKFVETHSYTVGMMLMGLRDFPNQMGSSTPNFTAEAQFGLDWLQKMWSDSNQTFYVQVGADSGNPNDHTIWRLPQADDTYGGCTPTWQVICHRPVFAQPNGGSGAQISPNLAGRLAADFALCFKVFKTSNPTYANQCLLSAEHVFDLAQTSPPPTQLITTAPYTNYPEKEWRDDMEWGATELYLALQSGGLPAGLPHTDPMLYLTAAANWANAYIAGPNDAADTLNLYDVTGVAHFDLYRAIGLAGNPPGLAVTQAQLVNDMNKALQNAINTWVVSDPFGFGANWGDFDNVSRGGGLVVMAYEYDFLTNANTYASYASRWQANVLGANAWGLALIGGDGTAFPVCMHNQIANLAHLPPNTAPYLLGAAVEGPNKIARGGTLTNMQACPPNGVNQYAAFDANRAVYEDTVQSWSTNEPAIDLTASSFLAFSWDMAGAPTGTP